MNRGIEQGIFWLDLDQAHLLRLQDDVGRMFRRPGSSSNRSFEVKDVLGIGGTGKEGAYFRALIEAQNQFQSKVSVMLAGGSELKEAGLRALLIFTTKPTDQGEYEEIRDKMIENANKRIASDEYPPIPPVVK